MREGKGEALERKKITGAKQQPVRRAFCQKMMGESGGESESKHTERGIPRDLDGMLLLWPFLSLD